MEFNDPLVAVFVFLIGTCVGSFLNVVVYRMPLGQSLVTPPSACPKCGHGLAWYDNIPVFGWLWLRGRCRYCKNPISARYPIVELVTGLLFLGHYLLLFHAGWGPYATFPVPTIYGVPTLVTRLPYFQADYPIFLMHLWLIAALLAASLIDLEHYIIPLELCWITAGVGLIGHTLGRGPGMLGSLHFGPTVDAMTLAAAVGVLLSIGLVRFKWLTRSFEDDAPLLEKDVVLLPESERPDPWTPARIRAEMRREMLYLLPALVLALLAALLLTYVPAADRFWQPVARERHASAFLGSLCGGLVGGGIVWLFRIAGSYGFGREAMGLGDVHLMLAIGCVLGPGAATAAFFLAPAAGLAVAVVQLLISGRREIPYGPYLSLAAYAMMLFYTPVYNYFGQGFVGIGSTAAAVWNTPSMATPPTQFSTGPSTGNTTPPAAPPGKGYP